MAEPNDELDQAMSGGSLKPLAVSMAKSAKKAGARAVASGRWLGEWVVDNAPRIPVRDAATLSRHHEGKTGDALAAALILAASRTSAGVGAATGALAAAEELMPPAWLALPLEVVVETGVVAAIELKLVAELHEVYGRRVPGSGTDRGMLLVRSWAERRGLAAGAAGAAGGAGNDVAVTRAVRDEVVRLASRRLVRRMGRNVTSLAPMLLGAVAGATMNRRATRSLGEVMARDLRDQSGAP
ncbi:MAG TPA: hypothetical protein VFA94_03170 [Acidimicrobiales bacterium]|nr:hypothetical protein [Acidimicrobiales bacterium]